MSRHKPFYYRKEEVLKRAYLAGMCAQELKEEFDIEVTTRSVQRFIEKLGITRSDSEHRLLSISKGRMSYDHLRKEKKAKEYRKAFSDAQRYSIMNRDGFRCVLCGSTARDGVALQLDHIIRPEDGGTNDPSNVRTLCISCNVGRYQSKVASE